MKKIFLLFLLPCLFAGCLLAQSDSLQTISNPKVAVQQVSELPDSTNRVVEKPDVMPEFPGGPQALRKYVAHVIKYPREAAMNKEQGKVYVRFIVESDGSISNVQIARGISRNLDAEAIRVVKSLPKWNPGILDGKPVRVAFTMPVAFALQ